MTVEFPLADGRVWPYLTGGGGTGSLRQTLTFRNLPLPLAEALQPTIFRGPEIDITATDLALTISAGLDVRLWKGLAVGGLLSAAARRHRRVRLRVCDLTDQLTVLIRGSDHPRLHLVADGLTQPRSTARSAPLPPTTPLAPAWQTVGQRPVHLT